MQRPAKPFTPVRFRPQPPMITDEKALFLDRDGVINKDFGYVYKVKDLEYIDGIFDLCLKAQSLGYLIIIITNQSGIARGIFSEKEFQSFMIKILDDFQKKALQSKIFLLSISY